MSIPRYFIENLRSIEPDARTGIVKLTFGVKQEDSVQIVVSAPNLHQIFGRIAETMQKTFGGGPGGRGPGPRGQRNAPRESPGEKNARFTDITQE